MLSAKEIDLALARRDRLYANIPRCQCGSDQVQLISATPPPDGWDAILRSDGK